MLQIMVQGRGGQGAQLTGKLLAGAYFREGEFIQAYSTYGGARRGTAVSSFIRVDKAPVRLRCDIEKADVIICLDSSLINEVLLSKANEKTLIIVNSTKQVTEFESLGDFQFISIDANAISLRNGLGSKVNSALLGAFCSALGSPDKENFKASLLEDLPANKVENLKAFDDGYQVLAGS